jgi:Cu+-exporting ATPase
MFVAVDGRPQGVGVADPIKESTAEAIRALHDDGIRIVWSQGQSHHCRGSGSKLEIDEVEADVLPEQKSKVVKRLQAGADWWQLATAERSPALAQAELESTMGTGTDVASGAG